MTAPRQAGQSSLLQVGLLLSKLSSSSFWNLTSVPSLEEKKEFKKIRFEPKITILVVKIYIWNIETNRNEIFIGFQKWTETNAKKICFGYFRFESNSFFFFVIRPGMRDRGEERPVAIILPHVCRWRWSCSCGWGTWSSGRGSWTTRLPSSRRRLRRWVKHKGTLQQDGMGYENKGSVSQKLRPRLLFIVGKISI